MATARQQWNSQLYQTHHSWVWQYGRDLLELLAPKAGECILDLGCGTGQLTADIANRGAEPVGIDESADMIAAARSNFPNLHFEVADAARVHFDEQFDAVFSNATLHWVRDQQGAIAAIARSLKPGGRFVFEMGGRGNLRHILAAARQALPSVGADSSLAVLPWFFPSIGEYAELLESHGIAVQFAVLFDRPTPLEGGDRGLANWIEMFGRFALEQVPPDRREEFFELMESHARPHLYRYGQWIADYKRLRMMAVKA